MSDYIPDPIERIEMAEERQMDKIIDGKYPCIECGEYEDPDKMMPISEHPAASLICTNCIVYQEEWNKKMKKGNNDI